MYNTHLLVHALLIVVSSAKLSASNENVIQIRKHCPVGEVLTVLSKDSQGYKCLRVDSGRNWTGILYDSETLQRLDPNPDKQIKRAFPLVNILKCKKGDGIWLPAKPSRPNDKPLFILLANGKLLWRKDNSVSEACRNWKPFPFPFYIDGVGYEFTNGSEGAFYSGHEYDQLLYYCNSSVSERPTYTSKLHLIVKREEPLEAAIAYTVGNIIILILLIFTFIFYSLTSTVYILLWESQTLAGRTLVSVVMSRAISIFIYFVSFNGFLNEWDVNLPTWWCVFIGVITYYFLNTCYSWTVILNFDLWWSFRSLKASADSKEIIKRKFLLYSGFGWGIPLVISTASAVIDVIYKSEALFVPNYGVDCFIDESSHYVYLFYIQLLFLVPGLIFGVLTFYALYKARCDAGSIAESNGGPPKSSASFQLNFKLFVVLGMSWIINVLLAWIIIPNSGMNDNVRFVLELVVLLIDSLLTAVLTFWIYVCKKSTIGKLEQKYPAFHGFINYWRQIKERFIPSAAPTSSVDTETRTQASASSTNV